MAKQKKLPILPRGMGNFEYLPSGSIRYRKYIKDSAGNKKRVAVTGETVEECMDKMKKLERGIALDSRKLTLEEGLRDWAETYKRGTMKPQSFTRLMKTVKYLSDYRRCSLAKMRYQSITSKQIQRHLTRLNDEMKSHSEIKKHFDLLNAFYETVCYSDDFKNPMKLVIMPQKKLIRKQPKKIEFLKKEEIRTFCESATERKDNGIPRHRYGAALAANIWMGLRIGELIALTWEDIKDGHIKISKTWVPDPKPHLQEYPKTEKNRVIPLSKNAEKYLKIYQGQIKKDKGPVLITCNNTHPDMKNLYDSYKSIIKRAKLDKIGGTHVLRHTTAKIMFDARIPLPIIAAFLGHSVEVLLSTYLSIIPEDYDPVVKALDDVFEDIDL